MPDLNPQPTAEGKRKRMKLIRVFPTTPGAVPVRLFANALRDLLAQPGAPTYSRLEARSGIPARTIYRVLNSIDRSVSFDVADALLTALDAIGLWHQPPLDQFLEPPPPTDTMINPMTASQDAARTTALARHQTTNRKAHT